MSAQNNTQLEFNERGKRIGWTCKHNHYKIISTNICDYCGDERPAVFSILGTKLRIEYLLRNDLTVLSGRFQMPLRTKELTQTYEKHYWSKTVDAKIELHMQFYNHEGQLCADMSDEELQDHLEELSNVAFEAKARIAKISDITRERDTKRKLAAGLLQFSQDQTFDSGTLISQPTERKKRMSKMEKTLADVQKLLGVEGASELIGKLNQGKFNPENVSVSQRLINSKKEKPIAEFCRIDRHSECNGTFRIENESFTCSCKCHAAKVDWNDPFGLNPVTPNAIEPVSSNNKSNEPILELSFDDLMK